MYANKILQLWFEIWSSWNMQSDGEVVSLKKIETGKFLGILTQ